MAPSGSCAVDNKRGWWIKKHAKLFPVSEHAPKNITTLPLIINERKITLFRHKKATETTIKAITLHFWCFHPICTIKHRESGAIDISESLHRCLNRRSNWTECDKLIRNHILYPLPWTNEQIENTVKFPFKSQPIQAKIHWKYRFEIPFQRNSTLFLATG